ncbi:hypothetical protein FB446DRAFT_753557 [Lentinula raphanica]|nr:hypothetical protein FB446DRAFT_753557 [Lentinula raphanica]
MYFLTLKALALLASVSVASASILMERQCDLVEQLGASCTSNANCCSSQDFPVTCQLIMYIHVTWTPRTLNHGCLLGPQA